MRGVLVLLSAWLAGCDLADDPVAVDTDPVAVDTDPVAVDTDDDHGVETDVAADTDPTPDTDDLGPLPCTPGGTRCADATTLALCEADGLAWRSFACPSACDDGGVAACAIADLEAGWELDVFEDLPFTTPVRPFYRFEQGGTVAIQATNAVPSTWTNTTSFERVRITGQLTVDTDYDDDLVGFVFGWQDPGHFYLLDWKQEGQENDHCGVRSTGVSLKRVEVTGRLDECVSLWADGGGPSVTVLSEVSSNPVGWADFTTYTFEIEHRPGDIRIVIRDGATEVASITSDDATWSSGRFGLYSYSQERVRYELLQVAPLP